MKFVARTFVTLLPFVVSASAQASSEEVGAAYAAKNYARTLAVARPLAEAGDASTQYLMGLLYKNGRGVEKSDAEALAWFTKAASHEHGAALNDLGSMFRKGEGVTRDDARAFELFKRSAERGAAAGQLNLAKMYEDGVATAADPLAARYWYERSGATVYERELRRRGRLQPEVVESIAAGKTLSVGCRPESPPAEAMNRRRVEKLTGHIDVFVDENGKIRGLRDHNLSNAELKFEAVAVFSESLRSENCRFEKEVRESSVRIPFTFELR